MANRHFWIGGGVAIGAALAVVVWPGEQGSRHDVAPSDPVLASFERELNHSTVPARPARGVSIDGDVLYRDINSINWSHGHDVYLAIKECEERLNAPAADSTACKHRGPGSAEMR